MPINGPAIALASSGSAVPIADTTCSATGSTRRRHTATVSSTHSARLHAAAVLTPEGRSVAESSQWSASRSASAMSERCAADGDGSGSCATVLRATSLARFQFTAPSWGCIIACIWLISAERSGIPVPPAPPEKAANICSNGVPRNGLFASSSGRSPGSLLMAPTYSPRATAAPLALAGR